MATLVSGALTRERGRIFTSIGASLSSGVALRPELWPFKGSQVPEHIFEKVAREFGARALASNLINATKYAKTNNCTSLQAYVAEINEDFTQPPISKKTNQQKAITPQ